MQVSPPSPYGNDQVPGASSSNAVGTTAQGEELAVQVTCDLGYLAMLLNEYSQYPSATLLTQIQNTYNSIMTNEKNVTDQTAQSIYEQAFSTQSGSLYYLFGTTGSGPVDTPRSRRWSRASP